MAVALCVWAVGSVCFSLGFLSYRMKCAASVIQLFTGLLIY